MTNQRLFFQFIFLAGLCLSAFAQQTVVKGARIPQLNETERNTISAVNASTARGQLIYNIKTNCLEFWDGSKWAKLYEPDSLVARNGLHLHTTEDGQTIFGLGANPLEEQTVIDMAGYEFSVNAINKDTFDITGNLRSDSLYLDIEKQASADNLALTWNPNSKRVETDTIIDWHTTGNAGTDPTKNFIGTTDNQPLYFKIDAVESGYLGKTGTSFGYNAMATVQAKAGSNTAFGANALTTLTIGKNNTAVGDSVLALTTGSGNTAVGSKVLAANTTGESNVAIGSNALLINKTGSQNTALGYGALSNSNASSNTAIGYQSMINNLTGGNNVAIGLNALSQNTTGGSNTAIGQGALQNSNGQFNVAIGANALNSSVSGSASTAVGYYAASKTTQANITAIGGYALANNTTGGANTAVGYNALSQNTTGGYNIALGQAALQNSNGTNNTAVGIGALANNDTGGYNIALGPSTLGANKVGVHNLALGVNALYRSTGNSNIAIGSSAGTGIEAGSSNIIIGNQTQPSTATASNELNIGNVLYGTNMYQPAGRIGIGVNAPAAKLDINAGSQPGFRLNDGTPTDDEGKVLTADANGVGTWQKPATTVTLRGSFTSNANVPLNMSTWSWGSAPFSSISSNSIVVLSTVYIDLPPGLWRLDFSCPFILNTNIDAVGDWIEFLIGFTTNASAAVWNSTYGGGVTDLIIGPLKANTIFRNSSFGFVENTSTTTQRYYMCIGRPTAMNGSAFSTASFTLQPNGRDATIYATSTVFGN